MDLADVGKSCMRLATRPVSGCQTLTDRNLQVARKCRIRRLLDVRKVCEVSNWKVLDLACRCPALHTVAMAGCGEVTAGPAGPDGLFAPREASLRHVWRSALVRVHPAGRTVFGDTQQVQRLFRGGLATGGGTPLALYGQSWYKTQQARQFGKTPPKE